jgi:hypothetical protein
MTKKPLEYPRNDTRLNPLWHLLKIKTWGTKWKRAINKIDEWTTWQWANAKIDKETLALLKQTLHISKENMEDYYLAMFTHAMDFFKEHSSLKKSIPKHFFTSLLSDLLTEDLVMLGNLLSTKFMKPKRQLYAIPSRQTRQA